MMSKKKPIAIPKLKNRSTNIQSPKFLLPKEKNDCVLFSFSALEWTEYFNLDATCQNWAHDLFEMLKSISEVSKNDLISGKYRTYRVHTHENATPPSKLPDGVELKDCYQLRISTSKGGIHGVFVENIFYIIWFDPLHNMYPDKRFGGLREIKPPNSCCRDREQRIFELQEEVKVLKEENEYWRTEIEKTLI